MSFPALLIIWLAVLFAAYLGGWVAHIMGRGTRNLSGVSYHAPTDHAVPDPRDETYSRTVPETSPPSAEGRERGDEPAWRADTEAFLEVLAIPGSPSCCRGLLLLMCLVALYRAVADGRRMDAVARSGDGTG